MVERVSIRRVHTGNRVLDDAQRTAQETAQRVNQAVFTNGVVLDAEPGATAGTGLSFTAGTARSIAHGLGRKAVGFLEVYGPDLPSAARVGLFPSAHITGVSSETHITVTPTSTGKCFVFVY